MAKIKRKRRSSTLSGTRAEHDAEWRRDRKSGHEIVETVAWYAKRGKCADAVSLLLDVGHAYGRMSTNLTQTRVHTSDTFHKDIAAEMVVHNEAHYKQQAMLRDVLKKCLISNK